MNCTKKIRVAIICVVLALSGCTDIKDFFNPPTPREMYARGFDHKDATFTNWKAAFEESINDSLLLSLPFQESGYFFADDQEVYSYNMKLERGEIVQFECSVPDTDALVFIDFYQQKGDSLSSYKFVKRNKPTERIFEFEVKKDGTYKIIIQPSIDLQFPFIFSAYTLPSFGFPVAGKGNSAIKSFWGAAREGGRRQHEGIDIFAQRGTPVVAATQGRISFTGNRGLGGKQVWLKTHLLGGQSLYYAHLDSITISGMEKVSRGDTLGFVGNTGNARTTSPHLHFGIYTSSGAVDPLPFVYQRERPEFSQEFMQEKQQHLAVIASLAKLRLSPSMEGEKIGQAEKNDTLRFLGVIGAWRHIQTGEGLEAFVHGSLVE